MNQERKRQILKTAIYSFLVICTLLVVLVYVSTEVMTAESPAATSSSSSPAHPMKTVFVQGFFLPVAVIFFLVWLGALFYVPFWVWNMRKDLKETKQTLNNVNDALLETQRRLMKSGVLESGHGAYAAAVNGHSNGYSNGHANGNGHSNGNGNGNGHSQIELQLLQLSQNQENMIHPQLPKDRQTD